MWRLFVALVAAAGCTTPCDQLKANARDCNFARGRYVEAPASVCNTTRQALGDASFDTFADCILAAKDSCNNDAIDACLDSQTEGADDACLRYRLWASACGLEPVGTADDCASLRDGYAGSTFDRWVACVTDGGCPKDEDARYDACKNEVVPESATDVLDACMLITGWSARCGDTAIKLPVDTGTDLYTCVAQAELFTAASYLAYGICLDGVACDDLVGRLECFFALEFLDTSGSTSACERLTAYSATCGSTLGGETVDGCRRLFARFTADSVEAFVSCVEASPCGDTAAFASCMSVLQLP